MTRVDRHSFGSRLFDAGNVILIFLIALTALYPFVYMAAISTSDFFAVGFGKVTIIPVDFSLDIYTYLFQYNPFIGRAYFNSILYTVLNTVLTVILCSMAGFALAQRKLAFRGFVGVALLVSMFFSGGLIPNFLWIRELGMLNSLWAIVLPGAVSAYYVILFRVYIHTNVSEEVLESVYVDGGGDFLVFFRIVLPLIKPMLATIALFAAVAMWNSFFSALIYLSDRKQLPAHPVPAGGGGGRRLRRLQRGQPGRGAGAAHRVRGRGAVRRVAGSVAGRLPEGHADGVHADHGDPDSVRLPLCATLLREGDHAGLGQRLTLQRRLLGRILIGRAARAARRQSRKEGGVA